MTITMATLVVALALSCMYCGVLGTYTSGQAQMQTSTSEQYCSFFANRAPAKQPTLKNCTWYKENSCCLQREIDATFNKVKPLQGASGECQRYMNFLMCYICAPNQNLFYSGGELTVCNDFCDKFYEACSSAILKGYVISELYASGYDFCQSRQYRVGAYTDIRCFRYSTLAVKGGASTIGATSTSLVLALLSSYLLAYNHVTSWKQFNWLNVVAVLSMVGAAFAEMNVEDIAKRMAEDLTSVAASGLEFERIQALYDTARYKRVSVNGTEKVAVIRHKLESFFAEKTALASDLSSAISDAYDRYHRTYAIKHVSSLAELGSDVFMDSDFMRETKVNLTRNSRFPRMKIHERRSSVKITDHVDRNDVDVARTVQWTHSVEALMRRNYEQYPNSIRWQYFGSSVGVYRQFPGSASPLNFVGFALDYDARIRPWYLSATSGAKDVVLILDASYTMQINNGLDIMKEAASTLVETFSMKDSIAVLVSRSSYFTPAGEERTYSVTSLGCHAKRLVPMTNYLKNQLVRQIDDLEAEGGADHRPAFTEAINLLRSSEAKSCHKLIIFLTNAVEMHYSLRCDRGKWKYDSGNQLSHKPGMICLNRAKKLVKHVKTEMGAYKIESFTLLTADDHWRNDQLGTELACMPATTVLKIRPYLDVHQQLAPYFTYLHGLTSSSRDVMWTSPYVSSDGLGLMLTAAKSVYSNATGQHLGVVGVDVSLSSVDVLLEGEQWNTAYGFLIDGRATAVIHPFVGAHDQDIHYTSNMKMGNIVDLETHGRKPEQFTQIVSSMLSGEAGDTLLTRDTYTALTSENNLYWTRTNSTHYYYSPISGTDFYYALRMNQRDADFQAVLPPRQFVTSYLDQLRDYYTNDSWKDHRDKLGIEERSKTFNGLTVARASSVVHLGPRCYCNTLTQSSKNLGLDFLHRLINTSPRPDQSDGGDECISATLHQQCLADVQLSSLIDQFWKNRSLDFDVLWTYLGLASGFLRVYPGVQFDEEYEPVSRVWYTAAAVNRGRITVSSPYLDASGAEKVVTISKTIHKDKPLNCMSEGQGGCPCSRHSDCLSYYCYSSTCANPIIHGVVALDMSYASFYERMMKVTGDYCDGTCQSSEECSTRCLLIDDLGDIVLDRDFLRIADTEQQLYEKVPLAGQFGKVFQTLLRVGIFRKQRRLDYQATCERSAGMWRPWKSPLQPDTSYNITDGPLPPYQSRSTCVVEVTYYTTNWEVANAIGTITNLLDDDPCSTGVYRFTHITGTNLFLLVVSGYRESGSFFNFNCRIMNSVNRPGRFHVRQELCSESAQFHRTPDQESCPRTQPVRVGDYVCSGACPIVWSGVMSLLLIRHLLH